ncbi:MAG: hypothetical protein HZA94_00755 [Candidatus Vogelbacteria bacterium]|nr:hypothetical protein [Candidatus Vogelbacteria bacterium]
MITKDKVNKFICLVGILWFIGLFFHWLYTSPKPREFWRSWSSDEPVATSTIDPTKVPWVITCDHLQGIEIGRPGYIYPDSDVWIIGYSDKSWTFSRYFSTDRKKSVGLFFWDKTNHMEEGSWSQEYPFDHGKWKMEGTPEGGFTGWLTNKDGQKLNFSLTKKEA